MHGLSGIWFLLLTGLGAPAWGESSDVSNSSSAFTLAEDDLERLAEKLSSRSLLPGGGGGGFHYYELLLGMLLAGAIAYLAYWRYNSSLERALTRKQKGEAIQALQDMDTDTLRRLLGNVNLPSWVNFPDFERVNWVNVILVQLWPYIAHYITEQSKPVVNQSLEANRPGWMESIKLLKFDLGEQAPKISGIKLYRQEESSSLDEILMECDFMWSGQQDVEILVKPVPRIVSNWLIGIGKIISTLIRLKVSMKKLIMNGRLRLTLTPLLKDIPFVGTVQVSLTDMPDFSFDLQVLGGDVTLLPGLEAWLNSYVRHSLLRPYVLPDKYTVQLTDADLGIETPKGILFLQLLEAEHVPRMDLLSKSDPYCKVGVRASRMVSSQVIDNDLNPKWDEDFKLLVHEPEHQVLRLVLYDHDTLDADDIIGEAKLPLTELKSEEERDLWLDVDCTNPKGGDHNKYKGAAGKMDKAKDKLKDATMKARQKLGRKKDKSCRVHIKVTYYEFQKDEVEAALDHHQKGHKPGNEVAQDVAERVHNKDAFNILMGGVLYVRPLKAHALMKKPWYKGGIFVKPSATVVVNVAEQSKKSARGESNDPSWGDTIEFILGADEIKDAESQTVDIEIWDYKASKSFRGEAQINLKDILDRGRMRETCRLKGVDHGEIEVECQWFKVLDLQPRN